MTKDKIRVLEKIFSVELAGHLPAQIKSKHLPELEREGYIERMDRTFGGRFAVIVKGWRLTLKGNCEYCDWAAQQPAEEKE